jgi:hypothetical protein
MSITRELKFCTGCGNQIDWAFLEEVMAESGMQTDELAEYADSGDVLIEGESMEIATEEIYVSDMDTESATGETPTSKEAQPVILDRQVYKRFVVRDYAGSADNFKILSGNFLSLNKDPVGSVDDTVKGFSRERIISDKLPDWDPLPPVKPVLTRHKKGH